jgi:sporulation protein YlmC with PRC-barrel domain
MFKEKRFMNTILKTFALALVALMVTQPVYAQDITYSRYLENLNEINRARPEQSPKFQPSKDILNDRILDTTNRVVGEVKDLLLTRSGSIENLNANFNRLKLGTDELYVNYNDLNIRPVTNGYKMSYTDDQIEEIFPSLLANMASAAGGDQDEFSLKKIVGSKVKAKDGRTLGTVKDVLFDQLGGRAELLLVSMSYKALRGETVAVPFSLAKYDGSGSALSVTMPNEMAEAMITYAGEK